MINWVARILTYYKAIYFTVRNKIRIVLRTHQWLSEYVTEKITHMPDANSGHSARRKAWAEQATKCTNKANICLSSVCRLSVTLMHPTQAVVIFGMFSTALGTLAIH